MEEGKTEHSLVEGSVPEQVMNLLSSVASGWGEDDIHSHNLKVIRINGGLTNEVYKVSWPTTKLGNSSRAVLVRFYGQGTDHYFNRDYEIRTLECLSKHGLGPRLLGQFSGGRIEEFIHARTLSAQDLRDPVISSLIAAKLREFHNLDMPGSKNVILWDKIRKFLEEAKNVCSSHHSEEFQLEKLEHEINLLEKSLLAEGRSPQKIGFCHHDLQFGNIMIDDKTITFIDYEFASYDPVACDLANYFCEMAGNYHSDTPHILDYTKYPGLEERRRFICHYLHSSEHEASESEVDKFVDDVDKYVLADHIFWGLWGIISGYATHEELHYRLQFAKQKLEQYWLRKHEIFSKWK